MYMSSSDRRLCKLCCVCMNRSRFHRMRLTARLHQHMTHLIEFSHMEKTHAMCVLRAFRRSSSSSRHGSHYITQQQQEKHELCPTDDVAFAAFAHPKSVSHLITRNPKHRVSITSKQQHSSSSGDSSSMLLYTVHYYTISDPHECVHRRPHAPLLLPRWHSMLRPAPHAHSMRV